MSAMRQAVWCCRGHVIRNNTLYLISMRSEDFGDYVCSARNRFGVEDGVMTLLPSGEIQQQLSSCNSIYLHDVYLCGVNAQQ